MMIELHIYICCLGSLRGIILYILLCTDCLHLLMSALRHGSWNEQEKRQHYGTGLTMMTFVLRGVKHQLQHWKLENADVHQQELDGKLKEWENCLIQAHIQATQ